MNRIYRLFPLLAILNLALRSNLNLYKTLYFNFKFLPFDQAKKFPIYIYHKLKCLDTSGKIIIEGDISPGMIKWNIDMDHFSYSKGSALFSNDGTLIFKGKVSFSYDTTITLQYGASIILGHNCIIGNSAKLRAYKLIVLEDNVGVASETQIFDTNFHYTRDIETGIVNPQNAPVYIKEGCWIGNRTSIMKGTVLPAYTIVASNSLLNKDYSSIIDSFSLLGGQPAKLLKKGIARVYDYKLYEQLESHFLNSDESFFAYQGKIYDGNGTPKKTLNEKVY